MGMHMGNAATADCVTRVVLVLHIHWRGVFSYCVAATLLWGELMGGLWEELLKKQKVWSCCFQLLQTFTCWCEWGELNPHEHTLTAT